MCRHASRKSQRPVGESKYEERSLITHTRVINGFLYFHLYSHYIFCYTSICLLKFNWTDKNITEPLSDLVTFFFFLVRVLVLLNHAHVSLVMCVHLVKCVHEILKSHAQYTHCPQFHKTRRSNIYLLFLLWIGI